MFLGCAVQAYVVYNRRKPIKSIVKCLVVPKINTGALNFCFIGTLLAQLVICYSAYVSFSIVTKTAMMGSMNLIFVATVNYVFSFQFCAITIGLKKLITVEASSLTRQISVNRQAALLEMCRTVNTTYQKQILLTLSQIFGYVVTYSYNLIMSVIHKEVFFEYVLFLFLNVVVRFSMLMLIVYSSETLRIKVNEHPDLVWKIISC